MTIIAAKFKGLTYANIIPYKISLCQVSKLISISLSPNTEKDDVLMAFKLLFQSWHWKRGKAVVEIEEEFRKYLGVKYAVSFNSGRSAFLAILEALGFERGSEIVLQAFTCNAASNPIIWAGLKPVYQDVNKEDFNIEVNGLEKKLSLKTKALVVQHTFGLAADMDRVSDFCRSNNLVLIEDCAHSLGSSFQGKKLGTIGKASFFSFSRDKIISSVYGGVAVTNDDEIGRKLQSLQENMGYPSFFWIWQQLLHPVLMNWVIMPFYGFLGKYLLILLQWLNVLSKAVHWKEKRGRKPGYFPKRLPNALALLALNQFKKLDYFNQHRKQIARIYFEGLKNSSFELPKTYPGRENVFLRFTVKHAQAHQIIRQAWKKNILLGDWYTTAIAPHDTRAEKLGYISGCCIGAEGLSKQVLNLPTHINISEKEAQKIISFLSKWK